MIRINEGKAIEKYLTHMLNKYSTDEEDLFDNYLYFTHLLIKSYEKLSQKDKKE
nr:MAG TPA: hypothetical protein [Caudoviricetes sp.]